VLRDQNVDTTVSLSSIIFLFILLFVITCVLLVSSTARCASKGAADRGRRSDAVADHGTSRARPDVPEHTGSHLEVQYCGTGNIPLYPHHLASSSSSASTARSYQSSATFLRPQAAFSAPTAPAHRPFAVHGSRTFTHVLLN
jgi:hypothetical protein